MHRRYSALSLLREGVRGNRHWHPVWRTPVLGTSYDVVIIGGGGHGLATAYYLAKFHGITKVAVLEKSWLGGGNTGRNTTVVRSNYFWPESAGLYDLALKLYETLAQELNYNIMLSQRGLVILAHSEAELESQARTANALQISGVDAQILDVAATRQRAPLLNFSSTGRYPIFGALFQPRAGTARHDAVAWGYARAADALGVDVVQGCEVLDFLRDGSRCVGVKTSLGDVTAGAVCISAAANSAELAGKAGFRLPITSYTLQALVSEPVKPVLDTVVLSPGTGTYVSQSDKGELVVGGGIDRIPSYARRGNLHMTRTIVAGLVEMFPVLANLRMMRQWGGTVDVSPDSSPILGPTPVNRLFINCGWGTGGFKAIPAGGLLMAHILASGRHHPLSEPFDIGRFARGAIVDEAGGAHISH
jgi:sarcosine oxidase, subunit beta